MRATQPGSAGELIGSDEEAAANRERRGRLGWGKLNATTVLLEPLNSDEADELIDRLLQPRRSLTRRFVPGCARPRETLCFWKEISAVVANSGGAVSVPPTIQALLAARLDQLDPGERRALERASVEGKSFHRGAVQALGPDETGVQAKLVTLVRKDLVTPDRPTLAGDDAFRFRQLLIRDAGYEGDCRNRCGPSCTSGSRTGWKKVPEILSSATRSSVTTSNTPTGTGATYDRPMSTRRRLQFAAAGRLERAGRSSRPGDASTAVKPPRASEQIGAIGPTGGSA